MQMAMDSNNTDNEEQSVNATEALLQQSMWDEMDNFFAQNPGTKIPRIIKSDEKVGKFVRIAWHNLLASGYEMTDELIAKLCSVEWTKKYTHRNLAFMIPVLGNNSVNTLKRYWTSPEYIEKINGEEYYVFSEWYPDTKVSKDAHRSDFLRLYIDVISNKM